MVVQYKKNSKEKLSEHFTVREFDCPCDKCDHTLLESGLVERLELLRAGVGRPLNIKGYRCAAYQADLRARGYETAVGKSQHELGRAADVTALPGAPGITGGTLEAHAKAAGFKAIGVGKNFIHVDMRDDKERRWTYGS